MPITRAELRSGPEIAEALVKCVVREEGHGKISTGVHHARDGEEFYAEGETFEVAESIAKDLKKKYYVDIVKASASAAGK